MLTNQQKEMVYFMIFEMNHFMINQDLDRCVQVMKGYNPTPEMFSFLLSEHPFYKPIVDYYYQNKDFGKTIKLEQKWN